MILYLGAPKAASAVPGGIAIGKNFLITFADYLTAKGLEKCQEDISNWRDLGLKSLFLDSGAFSSWSRQLDITKERFADFCLKIQDQVTAIASLDVIPGQPGIIPSQNEIDIAAQKGWDNYQYLLDKGVDDKKLLHTYHQGEDLKWLQKIVDSKANQIGISPANDQRESSRMVWLDNCMSIITSSTGKPLVKFHGFAATSSTLLLRYPWYSADSASWLVLPIYGKLFFPGFENNKENYLISPNPLIVTQAKRAKKDITHINELGECEKTNIKNYVEGCGESIETIANSNNARQKVSLCFWSRFAEAVESDKTLNIFKKKSQINNRWF